MYNPRVTLSTDPITQFLVVDKSANIIILFFLALPVIQGNVEYVAVRAGKDECATPAKLVQNYVVCELDKKMDVLLGFVKTHIKSKMIAFFSSCAQVWSDCWDCWDCAARY